MSRRRGLLLFNTLFLTAASLPLAAKPTKEFRNAFGESFRAGHTYAVVLKDGIPTVPSTGVPGHDAIDVVDGTWKRATGLFDPGKGGYSIIETLRRGEVMSVLMVDYRENRIDLLMESLEPHKGIAPVAAQVTTLFKFFFPFKAQDADDVASCLKYIDSYLKPFATREAAGEYASHLGAAVAKTVKLGQSRESVEATLGKPDKLLDLGTKVVYVYPQFKVVFVNGRVTDVQ